MESKTPLAPVNGARFHHSNVPGFMRAPFQEQGRQAVAPGVSAFCFLP